jgi:hypothetical protein
VLNLRRTTRAGLLRRATLARVTLVAVAVLVGGITLTAAPAMATPSAIGDGNVVDDEDYIDSGNPDPGVEATTGPIRDDACTTLAGAVTPRDAADAQSRLVGQTPIGAGEWQYTLCAQTKVRSQALAQRYPGVAQAKAYCTTGTGAACAVVVVWAPEDRKPPKPEKNPPKRLGAFDHWLDFTPELTTSPTHQDALIAQLPTWVWDRNTADIRGICLPLFGGVCGFATRLGTTWKTEGTTFCRSAGTPYRPGSVDPRSASNCSWTYRTSGTYGIQGCKNWLVIVWRLPWMIPIVFPLELCDTDQVSVQEAQILSGTPR